jgi:hypothetical protein
MELYLINGGLLLAVAFSMYITQADRGFFCQRMWSKLWKK